MITEKFCRQRIKSISLCVLLFAVTLAVFWPVMKCDFVNYDDPDYFTANPHVLSGLKTDNIVWAFTTGHTGNWHPLTWLSLMLDVEMFGPSNPVGPHLTNLLFHVFDVVLLFLFLQKLTGADFASAFVAALFAWHPLHVESVAWVSERKDVLSTLFGLLAFLNYLRYAKEGRRDGLWLAVLFFAFSLMSKPMLVTMPFVLLLLDWWPLGRLSLPGGKPVLKRLLLEKIPFFILSSVSCVITFFVQKKAGAVDSLAVFSMPERIENAFVAYARYLGKTIWPTQLADPYPPPGHWESSVVIFSVALVIGLSVTAVLLARRLPYVFTGWFWFVGTLIPVIGLVKVGVQSMADRYTYLPLIGIFIIFAWGMAEICAKWQIPKIFVAVVAATILCASAAQTRTQLGYWKNSETLFRHTLEVTQNNYVAYNDLGTWLSKNGQISEAMDCFQKALQINPYDAEILYNLGNAYSKSGDWADAINTYQRSLQIKPDQTDVLGNLGFALAATKQYTNAITYFLASLKLKPDSAEVHNNLASVLFIGHEFAAAEEHFREALRITPDNPQIYVNLGDTLVRENKIAEAAQCYQKALELRPDNKTAQLKLQALVK